MNIIFLLIGCSLFLALGFLGAFIWTVKSGQMDDEYTPSVRILFEDKPITGDANTIQVNSEKK
jgi:cbb3-type cytochrome oxidase maturation protein